MCCLSTEPSATDIYKEIYYKLSNLVWYKSPFPPLLPVSAKETEGKVGI
jgi:hypothetical protein